MLVDYTSDSHFSIQNIPFGVYSLLNSSEKRISTRLGDKVIDVAWLAQHQLLKVDSAVQKALSQPSLNEFMSLGRPVWKQVRDGLIELLSSETLKSNQAFLEEAFHDSNKVKMHLPIVVGDYTDFYASKEHATNVGSMFRGVENALMPNWTHLPVGYHGRASSIVVSGTDVIRPCGQRNTAAKNDPPNVVYGPSVRMDYELEMAFIVGVGNELGKPIKLKDADEHIFGVCLMNDWSARDIQAWEYVPLGPFLGKNFCTSISPWIVTLEALKPFLVQSPKQNPPPLPYLQDQQTNSAYDIQLEVHLNNSKWKKPSVLSKTNLKYMYWSIRQQLAHHTINGCNLRPGDVLGTGTISGPEKGQEGSMLEASWGGQRPVKVNESEERKFLEDGDEVILVGWCQGPDHRVGFGECRGVLKPANPIY